MIKKQWQHNYKNICAICGKKFYPNRRTQKTCSRKCGVLSRTGPTARASKEKYNTQCRECGKPIYRKPSLLKKNGNQFCAIACHSLYRVKSCAGERNPNYRNVPPKICQGCGQEYKSYDKTRRFCSPECASDNAISENIGNVRLGIFYEKECAKLLRAEGYCVTLSQASRGPFDIIALSEEEILLVQVKFTKRKSNVSLRKHCRILSEVASPGNCKHQLWVYVNGLGWHITEVSKDGGRSHTYAKNAQSTT